MIKLSEYLDVFIENLLKSRLFDFLLLNSIIFREDYPAFRKILAKWYCVEKIYSTDMNV